MLWERKGEREDMAISSKELAALLGVSPAAVSIALNGKPGISEATREMILKAAEEHGVRRAVRRETISEFINLLIFKRHGMVYGDTQFFSAVMEGISKTVAELGYKLQVSYFYENQNLEEQVKALSVSDCAGVILLATEMCDEDTKWFVGLGKPLVVLDSWFETWCPDIVVINNIQGAYAATRCLIEAGHRYIGHVCSSVEINNFRDRRAGFLKAITESDGEEKNRAYTTISVGSTQDTAYDDMSKFLDHIHNLPTALFMDNDVIAISCMRALKEHGYRIPEDVSVVGFDDVPMSYVTSPKMTTVHVPKEALGRHAVQLLLDRIRTGKQDHTVKIEINTNLKMRNTVRQMEKPGPK